MAIDDLLCKEESVALPCVEESSPADPPNVTMDATEVLDMLLQQETRGGCIRRNDKYLSEIQRHGMESTWRRKICHWMFEVRPRCRCRKTNPTLPM